MNPTLELLASHRSERSFHDRPISDQLLDAILRAAHQAPTSFNAQHISAVVVRDAERRRQIAELAGGQPWISAAPVFITLVVDFHKTALAAQRTGEQHCIHQHLEGMIAACTDGGIMLATLMTAARSLGLGVVAVGGIRANASGMIELLGLPEKSFALCGVALGYVQQPALQKPRLPLASFRHDERYDAQVLPAAIEAYDATLMEHWQIAGRVEGQSWSSSVGRCYARNYRPQLKAQLLANGLAAD
ncbi:nitroreductase family protein [Pseudomonas rubra]|uniref:Nitroreductase family protein n=1 Tax=Pseudomonas rubra TaxID=2942627 RepID=A0ABT5PE97_9PSED|nr:nitroreductase family protein [Pseudomonas rubra]MDD1016583.1 nitroreductase family protein [Pseudomonas rubra]MDD1038548.1 nitroreductase family protein [Pseudomonas rubra]MDD1154760.1 nitroreductase family protein [Pseudomonas rubra]